MATNHQTSDALQRFTEIRTQIHESFEHVALSHCCTLPMLLEETRSRGLHDDDVRNLLILDETETAAGFDSNMHFHCARSHAGVLYITRDAPVYNEFTSVFEAFTELWRQVEQD